MTHYEVIKNATPEQMAQLLTGLAMGIVEDADPEQITQIIDSWTVVMDTLREAMQEMKRAWVEVSAELSDLLHNIFSDLNLEELGYVVETLPKKSAPLRPPRYIGPKCKTAPRAQRPARVARSNCRKIYR